MQEAIKWRCDWRVRKYSQDDVERLKAILGFEPSGEDFERAQIAPFEDNLVKGNLVTTAGWTRITSLIIGAGGQAASNTAARIGVGNGAGTAAAGDTDLSAAAGAANRYFQPMDATFPSNATNTLTFQSTFAGANGNFAWNEFGIDIGAPTVSGGTTVNAVLLNHKTSIAQGTKTSGQSWVANAVITFT